MFHPIARRSIEVVTEALEECAVDYKVHRRTEEFQNCADFYKEELERHTLGRPAVRPRNLNNLSRRVADDEDDDDDYHDERYVLTVVLVRGGATALL